MTLDISQFYQTFFDEADELLGQMEQLLLGLNLGQPDPEHLAAIFRAAHSIKGGAATFGFTALTDTTHVLENLLDRARNNEIELRPDMVDVFLETKDVLSDQIGSYRGGEIPDAAVAGAICGKLERLLRGEAVDASVDAATAVAAEVLHVNVDSEDRNDGAAPNHVVKQAKAVSDEWPSRQVAQLLSDGAGVDQSQTRVTLRGVGEKDKKLLLEELGNLGQILAQETNGPELAVWIATDVTADDIVAVCCFLIDEAQITVDRDPWRGGAALAAPHTKVTLRGVGEKDRVLVVEELGNFGTVLVVENGDGEQTVWLETDVSSDDVVAVCCFLIDEKQFSVTRGTAPAGAVEPVQLKSPAVALAATSQSGASQFVPAAAAHVAPAPMSGAVAQTSSGAALERVDPSGKPASVEVDKKSRPAAAGGGEGSSIRVGVEKVDQLINLVGELVITQAMLEQIASTFDPAAHDRLFNGMAQLKRNARDLQEAVMSVRMMPMDYVFSRFPRLVRDLAVKLGKEIDLVTEGAATELDKSLIERIIDPLTHLVRNSLDHGIETVEKRRAAGKNAAGRLVLSAAHHGGNIVIEVRDDGAGLRRDKILAKAAQQGMAVGDSMTDNEVWNLIFLPGFSTAEQVTDVSGRGVGMDVVKRNIQSMGGTVEIMSQAGKGSTTRIILPLTLAILDGMSVKVGSEIYILPLNCVMESLQPQAEDLYVIANGDRVVRVRGEYLPVVALHEVFSVDGARTDPTKGIVTIMQAENYRFAMLVDELVGQQQVVVKNLETNYRKVHGISAATILGDGSVSLIVDVASLSRAKRANSGARN